MSKREIQELNAAHNGADVVGLIRRDDKIVGSYQKIWNHNINALSWFVGEYIYEIDRGAYYSVPAESYPSLKDCMVASKKFA